MFELTDRRALVTGAASGIGAGIARSYAAAGARLVLADRDSERLAQVAAQCRALGAVVTETVADVGDGLGHHGPQGAALRGYLRQALAVAVGQHQARPRSGIAAGDSGADAAGRAGHQGAAVCQLEHVLLLNRASGR